MTLINEVLPQAIARFNNRDEEGQGLVEYGLIMALVALLCVGALTALSGSIGGLLGRVGGALAGVGGA